MEKNEISGIPDHDVVVSTDDSDDPNDPVVSTDYDENTVDREFHRVLFNRCASHIGRRRGEFPQVNIDLESSSSKHEKHQPNDTKIVIEQLEDILGAEALKNIHERPASTIWLSAATIHNRLFLLVKIVSYNISKVKKHPVCNCMRIQQQIHRLVHGAISEAVNKDHLGRRTSDVLGAQE
ncbi:hypothetical protein LWI28_001716 [Acer negundo]|uniref:Uncharacterized protein n=1 Tax=Acer negundo TaxID=4023 RepID=A0AAD5I8W0_ACENE|nr:hypothetical protein LWI28_001716 [Acer negundo]